MDHAGAHSELMAEAIKSFFQFKTHPPIKAAFSANYCYVTASFYGLVF
ncbi:hypothetical protein D515_04650 [Grimontia indica]|uniref:Uncharacterized protein n=1 Tax=Grimontia indica TaxID=1056512 RepID=R1GLU5_9GAMM|nr:hypothetical protein D515_04650 [Grimontia indica]